MRCRWLGEEFNYSRRMLKDGLLIQEWVENITLNVPFVRNDNLRPYAEQQVQIWAMKPIHSGRYSCWDSDVTELSSAFLEIDNG